HIPRNRRGILRRAKSSGCTKRTHLPAEGFPDIAYRGIPSTARDRVNPWPYRRSVCTMTLVADPQSFQSVATLIFSANDYKLAGLTHDISRQGRFPADQLRSARNYRCPVPPNANARQQARHAVERGAMRVGRFGKVFVVARTGFEPAMPNFAASARAREKY